MLRCLDSFAENLFEKKHFIAQLYDDELLDIDRRKTNSKDTESGIS